MKRFKCVYMYGDHSLFSFKTSKERKKLWSYLPLFSLNASSFVVWFSLRDSEKTQPSLLKSSISHISSNQAHYFLCILWKPFAKAYFIYIDVFSNLGILVQICLATSLFFSRNRLIMGTLEMKAFLFSLQFFFIDYPF